ncbi:phospholipase/carboxylesterase [Microbacterium sp. CH12i]|uniref:alpha/beta hydrolase family protein n=1 Tax=Microbacterium profundi TaxID=450380 RepID=UPI000460B7C5|nr:alpha/beta fold hydrolase [Microbacterium profundi]KDA07146.1 phospholipase/carboxylesterase [Microbacterium sp. CH12i]MCE7483486.1 alpha/beta fold hydrolase [Microbacterium profundi]
MTIRDVEVDGDRRLLVLDRTRETAARGVYNLWFETGDWLRISDEVLDRGSDQIARVVTDAANDFLPSAGDRFSWSGIYFASPVDAGLSAREIPINTPAGAASAWLIEGEEYCSTWAIHIHGLGSTRAGMLRGAQVAAERGYTSLVISYRNDGEGPRFGTGRSMLGFTEAEDAVAAVDYAIQNGVQRIVLFGWSMGAAIALRVASRARERGVIVGLVLDSPVLDWVEVIKANCVRSGLPAVAGHLATPWLTLDPLARMVGLPGAIPLGEFDWVHRAEELNVPMLILHGTRDDSVPISVSEALRHRRPDLVELETFDSGHTLAWNSDPSRWRSAVSAWLAKQLAS